MKRIRNNDDEKIKELAELLIQRKITSTDLFSSNSSPWTGGTLNGGSSSAFDSVEKHYGIERLASNESANSGYRYYLYSTIKLFGREKTTVCFKTPDVITASAIIKFGFLSDVSGAEPVNQTCIRITGSNLAGITSKTGANSATESSYIITPATWYRTVIEVNADATLITFTLYADDSNTLLWTDTSSTNIPTTVMYHAVIAFNTGNVTIFLCLIDYFDIVVSKARSVS